MVLFLVLEPGKPGPEVLIGEGAFEGPVVGVQDHVLRQMRPASENLQTDLVQEGWKIHVLIISSSNPNPSNHNILITYREGLLKEI